MKELTRRNLLVRAGAAAAGSAAVAATRAVPAFAAPGDRIIGIVHDKGGRFYNVKGYGAEGDTVIVSGAASIGSGSTTLTWSGGSFVSADQGKTVTVQGAGASGAVLVATIATFTNATTVTLDTAASTAVSGADFSYGTDDTTAINDAIDAADAADYGVVYAPAGIYTITGKVAIGDANESQTGLIGCGGRCIPDASAAATVFLCAAAGAGVFANGWATFQGFLAHGNHIATAPLVEGVVTAGAATNGASYSTFVDVWSTAAHDDGSNEAGNGWSIYGPQNNTYWDCGTTNNDADGIYIDGGAGGLDFYRFTESGSGRYGVHGNTNHLAVGGYTSFTGNVHFFGGELISDATTQTGVSKIYNRGGQDWKFLDMTIRGDNLSGPTVDLDQNSTLPTYGIDFSGSTISATPTSGSPSPGRACIQITHGGSSNTTYTYAKMDRVRFTAGDSSVYLAANNGYYRYSARDWVADDTTHGPVGGSGVVIDALLEGRDGPWQTASLAAHWSGTVKYRVRADGLIELKGNAVWSTGAGGTIFSLPAGYRPNNGSGGTMRIAVSRSNGVGYITVASSGGAVATTTASGLIVYFDGVSFPTD